MQFKNMMTDTIKVIKKDGNEYGTYKASVQAKRIYLIQSEPLIEEGDTIQRIMSNGATEKYIVVDPGFKERFGTIQANYQMTVDKVGVNSSVTDNRQVVNNFYGDNARVNNNSVDNSTNIVNTNNNIDEQISSLRNEIENLVKTNDEKEEALAIVDEIDNQFKSGNPNKTVVRSLVSSLPQLGNIAAIGSFILGMFK